MQKLYFIGGIDTKKREGTDIYKKAFLAAGGKPTVLVFPWTREKEKLEWRKIIRDYYEDMGVKRVVFAELSDTFQILTKKASSADVIYLPGGDPRILIKNIRDKKVNALLKNFEGVLVGNSAGALAFCNKYVVVKGQDDEPKTGLEMGIGLADINVTVHYGSPVFSYSGEGDLGLIPLSKKVKIYAIPEYSALVYSKGTISYIGEIYLLSEGKKTKLN